MAVDWRPSAEPAVLALRARLRARIRTFFEATATLEVETPSLSAAAPTETHIQPLVTETAARPGPPLYLQSSPEFPTKRLLAAGVGDCWQLARVFRDGERGRYHNPEFDLLEWYRVGADHHALMDDVEALVSAALGPAMTVAPAQRYSYAELFHEYADIDPFDADTETLQDLVAQAGLEPLAGVASDDRRGLLERLLAGAIAPALARDRPTFIYDWPVDQAALARIDPDDDRIARRFELYWGPVELANGFHELLEPGEQRRRFEADQRHRAEHGERVPPIDEALLAAMASGLPDCAGVALGFDRLAMVAAGADHIDEVLAFPLERA
jgi:lysyl-tRNA synthetase class 2